MPAVVSFFIFITLVIITSPLLSYPVYLILQNFIDISFYKLVHHVTLINGLIFSGVYLKYNQLYSKQAFGFGLAKKSFLKELLQGFVAGISILAFLKLVLILSGVHQITANLDYFWSNLWLILIKAVLTGLVVALIEETIFRGALFSALYKKTNALLAILLTSLVYAAVHFLKYKELSEGMVITWSTGLEMLPSAFSKLLYLNIIDHFLTLFILGVLLSIVRLRNNNIALCIGIHAGIVMAIKVSGKFSDYVPGNFYDFLVNASNQILGYLSFAWLLILVMLYWRTYLYKNTF